MFLFAGLCNSFVTSFMRQNQCNLEGILYICGVIVPRLFRGVPQPNNNTMATFKAEIQAHQPRKDGTYNVKIRVTHNRRKKYLPTQYYIGKGDLTRSGKIKNQIVLDGVERLIREWRERCNAVGEGITHLSVEQVVEIIKRGDEGDWSLDFIAYGRGCADEMGREGRRSRGAAFSTALNRLAQFVGRESLPIQDVTATLLNAFVRHVLATPRKSDARRGRVVAAQSYISTLRAIYNRAKREFNDEEAGFVPIPFDPFRRVELPNIDAPKKRAITADELRAIAALPDEPRSNSMRNLARDMFLLSFGLMGMNAADIYAATDYKEGRIEYERQKTHAQRADNAFISIKVEPEVAAIIEKYRDPSGSHVFDLHSRYYAVMGFNSALSRGMRAIGEALGIEGLQFYAARHTWATLAVNEVGVDKYTVHGCLNHVDPTMAITDVYIKKDWRVNDRANRAVLDYVFGEKKAGKV